MAERAPNIVFVLVVQRGTRRLMQAVQGPMLICFIHLCRCDIRSWPSLSTRCILATSDSSVPEACKYHKILSEPSTSVCNRPPDLFPAAIGGFLAYLVCLLRRDLAMTHVLTYAPTGAVCMARYWTCTSFFCTKATQGLRPPSACETSFRWVRNLVRSISVIKPL